MCQSCFSFCGPCFPCGPVYQYTPPLRPEPVPQKSIRLRPAPLPKAPPKPVPKPKAKPKRKIKKRRPPPPPPPPEMAKRCVIMEPVCRYRYVPPCVDQRKIKADVLYTLWTVTKRNGLQDDTPRWMFSCPSPSSPYISAPCGNSGYMGCYENSWNNNCYNSYGNRYCIIFTDIHAAMLKTYKCIRLTKPSIEFIIELPEIKPPPKPKKADILRICARIDKSSMTDKADTELNKTYDTTTKKDEQYEKDDNFDWNICLPPPFECPGCNKPKPANPVYATCDSKNLACGANEMKMRKIE